MFDAVTIGRFWGYVDKRGPDDCWLWTGYKSPKGYGYFSRLGKNHRAHRVAVILAGREIPADMVCDHLCRNRDCVNPAHIEIVTNRQNVLRGVSGVEGRKLYRDKEKYCVRGHERTPENTIFRNNGYRHCKLCKVITDARRYTRKEEPTHDH